METKKEARQLAGNTGIKGKGKITNRKRIKRFELAYKWQSGSKYLHFVGELS